jgi:regulator of nucleoside diphosphate kinase
MKDQTDAGLEPARPEVTISAADYDRLAGLATAAVQGRVPGCGALLLLDEIGRAEVVPAGRVPPGVVAMHSRVEYRDEATGATRRLQLVYPHEADIAQGKVSVLTPVGAALIGLAEGESIEFPTGDGRSRRLTVLAVAAPAPAEAP